MSFWTDEKVGLLKRLWNEGLSGSEIAKEIHAHSRSAVIAKANRIGLPRRRELVRRVRARLVSGPVQRPVKRKKRDKAKPHEPLHIPIIVISIHFSCVNR